MEEIIFRAIGWVFIIITLGMWIGVVLRGIKKHLRGTIEKSDLDWLMFASVVSLVIVLILAIAMFASAAENSALPAPAENAVVAEKPVASCPTEFNPDESAWAMSKIDAFIPQKISDDLLAVEQIRYFSYFPDPEQRIFVGIKKLWNPDCVANLYSFGSRMEADGKRVLGAIKSREKTIIFLFTEKEGWKNGDEWETFVTDCSAKGCNLTFALYRNKEPVASRTLFIKQFSHFREPVE